MNTSALVMPNSLVAYSSDITPSVTDRFLHNQPTDKGLGALNSSASFLWRSSKMFKGNCNTTGIRIGQAITESQIGKD